MLPASSTLSPPAALLSPEEGTGLELEKVRPHLPTCNQSVLLSPWTGAYMQEELFFPKRSYFYPKQCIREPACRRGRAGGQRVGLQLARVAPIALPGAFPAWGWNLEARSPGENSGSTKGNPSGSPEIFPQPGEKTLK